MAKTMRKGKAGGGAPVLRFAHPFFTDLPPAERQPFLGARRMTEHVEVHLEPIPRVSGESKMTLADVVGRDGAAAIAGEGAISFHAIGDTGHENGQAQEYVAEAMTADFDISHPERSPAFFLHLGDVDYYDNTDRGYHAQFYVPYKTYPGKIVAIPGNHDGELFKFDGKPTGQSKTLEAFQKNFCQKGAATTITSGTVLRQMVSQPGVYWRLSAPLIDIVGLYSNVAENPGFIRSPQIGDVQKRWLTRTLRKIKSERAAGTRRALVVAVHHPPISHGSHSSSADMLVDIDDSCTTAGIQPDALLAAHSHDYQRFTRFVPAGGGRMEVPYLVVGSGGRGLSTKVAVATGQVQGDHRYDKSLRGYGYLLVSVTPQKLDMRFFQVDEKDGKKKAFDQVSVVLATNKLG